METNKPRANSALHALPPEQRAQVAQWLFEDNCSYAQVAERCREQFGLTIDKSNVGRYFQREAIQWHAENAARNVSKARLINEAAGANPEELYRAAVNLTVQRAFEKAQERGEEPDMVVIGRLMRLQVALRRQANEAERVRLEAERVRLDGERTEIARAKFEFDAVTECLEHQMELEKIMADKTTSNPQKVLAAREALFGGNLPQ